MANARLDQNGVPKGPVYEWTAPLLHRSAVAAVDASDPADTSGAVDCAGYQNCRFDIAVSGTGFSSLEVQAIFWNSRQGLWFGGGKRSFTTLGRYTLVVDARGSTIFLKVTAFSGTSFSLHVDYSLS